MEYRIGCSGWSYRHWRDDFYPKGVPQSRWLEHYASVFDTVELNNSFYKLPSENAVRGWKERSPEGFTFAVKASRLITHYRRLRGAESALETFLERMKGLGDKLGPVLFQTPPRFRRDEGVLRDFLALLPEGLMPVFEFRDDSWWKDSVFEVLRDGDAAFCIYNAGQTSTPVVATCRETYVRFHGPVEAYRTGYGDGELREWRDRIEGLGARRAWVYFNNDVGGHAHRDARTLIALVRQGGRPG